MQDGGIGPKTLKLVEEHTPKQMIEKMHDKRQGFYEGLKTFDTFGKGWTRRNYETREKALELAKARLKLANTTGIVHNDLGGRFGHSREDHMYYDPKTESIGFIIPSRFLLK